MYGSTTLKRCSSQFSLYGSVTGVLSRSKTSCEFLTGDLVLYAWISAGSSIRGVFSWPLSTRMISARAPATSLVNPQPCSRDFDLLLTLTRFACQYPPTRPPAFDGGGSMTSKTNLSLATSRTSPAVPAQVNIIASRPVLKRG